MANPVVNYSFEEPGTGYGEALSWTEGNSGAAEDVAQFGAGVGQPYPYEEFEDHWLNNQLAIDTFSDIDLAVCVFESAPYVPYDIYTPGVLVGYAVESFEYSWQHEPLGAYSPSFNHQSIWAFDPGSFSHAVFTGALDREGFETGWDTNQNAVINWSQCTGVTALFDSGADALEDFNQHWGYWGAKSNEDSISSFTPGDLTVAMFDAGAVARETFDGVWTELFP